MTVRIVMQFLEGNYACSLKVGATVIILVCESSFQNKLGKNYQFGRMCG